MIAVVVILLSVMNAKTAINEKGAKTVGAVITSSWPFVVATLLLVASTVVFCLLWIRLRRDKVLFWEDSGFLSKLVIAIIVIGGICLLVALFAAMPTQAKEFTIGFLIMMILDIALG